MALNPASYNPGQTISSRSIAHADSRSTAGLNTGPASEPPPPTSSETTAALLGASKDDPMGQHEGGQDKQGEGALDKLEKEMEKEKDEESGGGGKD